MGKSLRVLVIAGLASLVTGCASARALNSPVPDTSLSTPSPAAASTTPASKPAEPPIRFPVDGSGTWLVAEDRSPVAGHRGRLLRYRVAVERDISGVDVDQFGARVATILADPRSWTGRGGWRLQRVGPDDRADFTIYLATPATRDRLCAMGYDRYTSCRNGNKVVLNVDRWAHGVPRYGASLDVYRAYMVNHEVGHRLGHGHKRCPGKGRPAPVMQQQTLGLRGCLPNPWPYR
jgi:hypothetical protein